MNQAKNNNTKNHIILFSKITDKDIALNIIKETSLVFIIVGIYQCIVYYFIGINVVLVNAAICIIFGFVLRKWKSRIAAIILLIQACIAAVITILHFLGYTSKGEVSIIIVIAILFIAIRAVEATFKLHGRYSNEV